MKDQSLQSLVEQLSPRLNHGQYVFCVDAEQIAKPDSIVACFREREGTTVVLEKDLAIRLGLSFESIMAWITLDVQSSLQAVGLTAVVSNELAQASIACNVMAGYHHDHLFVPFAAAEKAMKVLDNLRRSNS